LLERELSPDRDVKLVRLVAGRDEAAFEELVDRHQHSVLNTIHRYVGEYDAAADLAQEVFVIVWNKADRFRGQAKFSTWLYRVVVNQCLQYRRKRRRRPVVLSLDSVDPDRPPEALQVGDGREQADRVAAVRQALARLPDRQRIALVLSHYEGRSYAEVAGIMGTSASSVESLLVRARAALREQLGGLR